MVSSNESQWFAGLVGDFQRTKPDATEESILNDLLKFRYEAVSEDIVFEKQYPDERTVRNWPKQKGNCDIRNADLLLSFIAWASTRYGEMQIKLCDDLVSQLDKSARIWEKKSNILSVLARDFARRGARKTPNKENIWEAQSRHVSAKYSGFYILLRFASNKKIRAELFCIQKIEPSEGTRSGETLEGRVLKTQHQGVMRVLWGCESDFWCGDLIIGRDKFAGAALKWDTARLPDPITISLMRHKEERFQTSGPNISFASRPVLTGMIVGWNTINSNELFRCICAAEKLNCHLEPTVENFKKLYSSAKCKSFLKGIEGDSANWVGKRELEAMFADRKRRLHRRACQEVLANTTVFQGLDIASWLNVG